MLHQSEKTQQNQHDTTLVTLAHLGLLRVSGPGAKQLLQGQLTCNLDEISSTESRLGAYCTPQGRMLSLFRIFQYEDDYYLQMPAAIVPDTLAALKKYAAFFKVTLSDGSQQLTRLSYSGKTAEAELLKRFASVPQAVDSGVLTEDVLIIKLPGETPHYELIGTPTALWALANTAESAENTWKYLNISAGIPDLTASTIGKFLPHELNLPALNGVSFNKGCYTGQEIVARMHYRGQLKKHLFRGRTAGNPTLGEDIYDDTGRAGVIVDSCLEGDTHFQILFIADKNAIETKQFFADFAKIVPIELIPA
jgi:folate-binding protein YgfZ